MTLKRIGAGVLLAGVAALVAEQVFVAGIDANGVVQESFLLPFGAIATIAGVGLLAFAALRSGGRRH